MFSKIVMVGALVLAGGLLFYGRASGVTSEDARKMVAAGARLVDVRTVEEFTAGHIQGAVNIPVQDLERRMAELEPKDKPIVLYCRSGARSGRAQRALQAAGFKSVHNLGPMSKW